MIGNEEKISIYEKVGNEENTTTKICNKNGIKNGIVKNIDIKSLEYVANITDLDLSNRKLSNFDENLELPLNIVHLKLSNNKLTEVPSTVLKLNNLKTLDLSFNSIVFFDDTPSFCHSIEWLNLSNNHLEAPPFWVWAEKPKKLAYLNLSYNQDICQSFTDGYFEELFNHKTQIKEIDMQMCRLEKYMKLMATFCYAKVVNLGSEEYDGIRNINFIELLPCAGLEECREVEKMNVSNTRLYHINSNIDIYRNLKEINLAQNNLYDLPNEFCNLKNLESCKLSYNKILYLPENMDELTNLQRLYLNDNRLCMLPQTLHEISSLKILDVYNNDLHEVSDKLDHLEEVDYAQNYFDEPNDEEYLVKKEKLRINCLHRIDGRRNEPETENSIHSNDNSEDDEELYDLISNESENGCPLENHDLPDTRCSTPEDWDSDDYWIPQYYKPVTPPRSPWIYFVKKKMAEGNFCPMDVHPVSIADKIKYENECNPPVIVEVYGQFDDYSDDDS